MDLSDMQSPIADNAAMLEKILAAFEDSVLDMLWELECGAESISVKSYFYPQSEVDVGIWGNFLTLLKSWLMADLIQKNENA